MIKQINFLMLILSGFFRVIYSDVARDVIRVDRINSFEEALVVLPQILCDKIEETEGIKASPEAFQVFSELVEKYSEWKFEYEYEKHYAGYELYHAFVQLYSKLEGFVSNDEDSFVREGWKVGNVSLEDNIKLVDAFNVAKPIALLSRDVSSLYTGNQFEFPDMAVFGLLNNEHQYLFLDSAQLQALVPIIESLKKPVTDALGIPWTVSSVRAWETGCIDSSKWANESSGFFGPLSWHRDGHPAGCYKILFYPNETNMEKGTTQLVIEDDVKGDRLISITEPPGAWLLFRNASMLHRGVSPKEKGPKRLIIEITIVPSLTWNTVPVFAGGNAVYPKLPWRTLHSIKSKEKVRENIIGINIGGGRNWKYQNWLNLDEMDNSSFMLSSSCSFPVLEKSLNYVYSSHTFEHLNIPTVYRLLSESFRSLKEGGDIIIRIPDYERILVAWHNNDSDFFKFWGIPESVMNSWTKKGNTKDIDYQAAMIFCSFWNDAYGNPFSGTTNDNEEAYFGPPSVDKAFLERLRSLSPFEIASKLADQVRWKERNAHFCHQNAWSREEMKRLLESFGFEVITFEYDVIYSNFEFIPGICDAPHNLSMYCWAKKSRIAGK